MRSFATVFLTAYSAGAVKAIRRYALLPLTERVCLRSCSR